MPSPRIQALLDRKTSTPEDAVKAIRSGDRVYLGSNCAVPQVLVNALYSRRSDLYGVEVVHLITFGEAPYTGPECIENFRHLALFIGPNTRPAIQEGRADYVPVFLSEIPDLFKYGQVPLDVAMVQVSPPDDHGFVSLGISVDIGMAACKHARFVIAEVNPRMPRTLGASFLHLSEIDKIVPVDYPVLEHPGLASDDVSRQIAHHIAGLIEDGCTLQMGIGGIPDAVLRSIEGKSDLGVHTEMFSDGIVGAIEQGTITCRRKTLHPNKVIASFCFGSKALYEYVHNNPFFEFHPTEYVNDPYVIGLNDKMVSINSALEIDLTGQVVADSIGSKLYSGIGGQVDFVRGAARSKGGKAVIALPSTAKGGAISRIVPTLKPGAGVVTSRGDVQFVVTEFGTAYLHGKSIRERALSLIRIAHPKFRDELLEQAKECGFIPRAQPSVEHPYPHQFIREITLQDGEKLRIRPIRPTDDRLLTRHFYSLSEESVRRRFSGVIKALSNATIQELVNVDYDTHMAFTAVREEGQGEEAIGIARYYVNPVTGVGEFAMAVIDSWQGKGLGKELMKSLIHAARAAKLRALEAFVLADNHPMLRLLRSLGLPEETEYDLDQVRVKLLLDRPERSKDDAVHDPHQSPSS